MRRQIRMLALAGALLALCGCSGDAREGAGQGGYLIYYSALDDRNAAMAVGSESLELPEGAQVIPALVNAAFRDPASQDLTSPYPDGVRVLSWELLEDGCLHLDLSEQYGSLTGIDLTVADACLTLTLCQAEGVASVYLTVEGDEIPYRPIQQLTREDVLLSTGQESPPPATTSAPVG